MKTQSGNALFMILIAVFLLGALTALVARTGSNTEETGDTERANISASKILRDVAGFQSAVENLFLKGCSENDISFENPVVAGYENPNSPADHSCHLFDVRGSGLQWVTPPPEALQSGFAGRDFYGEYGFPSNVMIRNPEQNDIDDGPYVDLVVIAPYLTEEVCTAINRTLGVDNTLPQNGGSFDSGKFTGTYGTPGAYHVPDIEITQKTLCLRGEGGFGAPDTLRFPTLYSVLKFRGNL